MTISSIQCDQCETMQKSIVTDSRPFGEVTRRRRECLKCGHRWSTVEVRATEYDKLAEPQAWGRKVESKLTELLGEVQRRFMP
jgi:transcriptional regulator NrdR family protein